MNIRNKLVLYFLPAVLVPAAIITITVFTSSRSIILDQMRELVQKNLHSSRLAIQQRLLFAGELTSLIYAHPAIRDVLSSNPSAHSADNLVNLIYLDHALDSYIRSIYFSINSISINTRLYLRNRSELLNDSISSRVMDHVLVENEYWYKEAGERTMIYTVNLNDDKVIAARKLYDLRNIDLPVYAALLTIEISAKYFNELLNTYKSFPGSRVYILNEHGAVILGSDPVCSQDYPLLQREEIKSGAAITKTPGGEAAIIAAEAMPDTGWTIMSITYLSAINLPERVFTLIVIGILTVSVIVSLAMAILLSNAISRPIVALVQSMRTVGEHNNFNISIAYTGSDEFSYLISQYKNMITQIRDLIGKLYISEMNKHQAELDAKNAQIQALQAQINPHFLYNTLDSINLYAIKYNVPAICEMIESMANFFRYTLSGGSAIITLQEEITHTRNYLKLQSMRMGSDLKYDIAVSGELQNVRIVKLVMQPLVENSIIHGFKNKKRPLEINITTRRNNEDVVIVIKDNGIGADTAAMNRLLGDPSDSGNSNYFAVSNVHKRVQNTFGTKYGLCFFSEPGAGTSVHITIPMSSQGESNKYD